jgi:hypothetical protein
LVTVGRLRLAGGRQQAMRAALDMVRRCYHGMIRLGATVRMPFTGAQACFRRDLRWSQWVSSYGISSNSRSGFGGPTACLSKALRC